MLKPLGRNEETNPLVLLLMESQIRLPGQYAQVRGHNDTARCCAECAWVQPILSSVLLKCLVGPLYICISSLSLNGAAVETPKKTITRDKKGLASLEDRPSHQPPNRPRAPTSLEITTPDSRGILRRDGGIPATDIRPPAGHSGRGRRKVFGCLVSHRQEGCGKDLVPPLR